MLLFRLIRPSTTEMLLLCDEAVALVGLSASLSPSLLAPMKLE